MGENRRRYSPQVAPLPLLNLQTAPSENLPDSQLTEPPQYMTMTPRRVSRRC